MSDSNYIPGTLVVTFADGEVPPCFSEQSVGQSIRAFGLEWRILGRGVSYGETCKTTYTLTLAR